MKFSYSRFASYLRCPYKHYLGYYVGLRKNAPVKPLYFGTDFHKLLELRNKPEELAQAQKAIGDAYYDLPAKWQEELGDDYLFNLQSIFSDYIEIYKDSPQPTQTERPFEIEIGSFKGEPIIFNGIIDEVYKYRRNGEKMCKLGDHKTFNRKPDQNVLVMNTQKNLYAKAMYIMTGVMPKSFIWDYIHSTPASMPIWLPKSGKFSQAKSNNITPFSWRRACELKGITDIEVLRQGNMYVNNVSNFFFRCELDIVPSMVDNIFDGFKYTCRDIVRQGHKNKTKNMTPDCKFCEYRDICFTELTEGDVDNLIAREYEIHERDDSKFIEGV